LGVERVLDAMEAAGTLPASEPGPDLFLVPMDERAIGEAAALARTLRSELHVEHAYVRRAPGKGLRDADRAGARWAALRGERERERGVWTLKHLARGEQLEVDEAALAAAVLED